MNKCVFIGYPPGYKGWKFYNPETHRVVISEQADFNEWYTYDGELLEPPKDNSVDLSPIKSDDEDPDEDTNNSTLHDDQLSKKIPTTHPPIVDPITSRLIAYRQPKRKVTKKGDSWSYQDDSGTDQTES